jgi:hypothetical protein
MNSAMGMVMETVNVPHGLCFMALTTISASTAIRITMMVITAASAAKPPQRPEFIARHLSERAAVTAQRGEQDHEVLHAAAEHAADQDPQRAGQVTELRGEGRTDQGPGAGDGGEVMAEHDPAIGRHEIAAVIQTFGRRRATGVEHQHAGGDEGAVETKGQ